MNLITDTLRDWLKAARVADVPRWVFFVALAIVVAVLSGPAWAETNLVWSPTGTNRDVGTWQCATDSTPVLTGSSYNASTIVAFGAVAATANVYRCTADRPIGAGAGCPTTGSYTQEGMAPKSQARLCAAAPPPPPPPPPPVPPGPPAKPWELHVYVTNDECKVTVPHHGVNPMWTEAQLFGSTQIIRSADLDTYLTCAQLGLTKAGEVQLVRLRTANAGGGSPWTGYWPVLRFSPEPADPNLRSYERIEYAIIKHASENYTLQPTDARRALCLVDGISSGVRPLYAKNGTTRGTRITPDLSVGPTTVNAGDANPFQRVECSCTDVFAYSNAVYARVLGRTDGAYVAACRHTGNH